MAGPFKVGDLVQLRSGGPKMTVTEELTDGKLRCAWFTGANVETIEEAKPPEKPSGLLKFLGLTAPYDSPLGRYVAYKIAKRELYEAQQAANKRNQATVDSIKNETGVFRPETLIAVADEPKKK